MTPVLMWPVTRGSGALSPSHYVALSTASEEKSLGAQTVIKGSGRHMGVPLGRKPSCDRNRTALLLGLKNENLSSTGNFCEDFMDSG